MGEDMRALFGKSWNNGISYVGAVETYLRTPFDERGREHNVSRGTYTFTN